MNADGSYVGQCKLRSIDVISEEEVTAAVIRIHRSVPLSPDNFDRIKFYIDSPHSIDYQVFFYGILVTDTKDGAKWLFPVLRYIKRDPVMKRLIAEDVVNKRPLADDVVNRSKIKRSETPKIPLPKIKWIEVHSFTLFIVQLILALTLFLLTIEKETPIDGLASASLATVFGLITLFLLIMSYRIFIKKPEVESRLIDGVEKSFYQSTQVCLLILVILSILLTLLVFFFGSKMSMRSTMYWAGSATIACGFVLGFWTLIPSSGLWSKITRRFRPKESNKSRMVQTSRTLSTTADTFNSYEKTFDTTLSVQGTSDSNIDMKKLLRSKSKSKVTTPAAGQPPAVGQPLPPPPEEKLSQPAPQATVQTKPADGQPVVKQTQPAQPTTKQNVEPKNQVQLSPATSLTTAQPTTPTGQPVNGQQSVG